MATLRQPGSAGTDMSLNFNSGNEIFIVDDDQEVCDSLAMALTIEGDLVTVFQIPASFIAAARGRTPACVLLDLYMPVKSGLDVLKEIDARSYPAPILMVSANGAIRPQSKPSGAVPMISSKNPGASRG
jgi:FixJ family two-component response regulator